MRTSVLGVIVLGILICGCAALQPGTPTGDKLDKDLNGAVDAANAAANVAKGASSVGVPYSGLVYGGLIAVAGILNSVVALRHAKQQSSELANVALNTVPAPKQS